jgi:DNA-binding NarL/FixJ family response regulator
MDVQMPEVDGVTATRLIAGDSRLAGTKVVVLTTFDDDETVFAALRAGASGFLVKDVEPEELLQAVRVVARGDALLSPGVTRAVIAAFTDGRQARPGNPVPARGSAVRAAPPGLASLTEREREVVALVAAGLSNDEIARQLVVSPLTAKTHVSRAMTKLNARDRAQLVVLAYEHGLTASWRPGSAALSAPGSRSRRREPPVSHLAAGGARYGRSRPATLPQDLRLQQGGPAGVAVHVAPAVAGRIDALRASLDIAPAVAPALLVRVRHPAVELDGK